MNAAVPADDFMRFILFGFFLLSVLISAPTVSWSQAEDSQNVFDWYYSAVFGTGVYRVGGRDVAMFRVPYTRELWAGADRSDSVELTVPLTLGVYAFEAEDIPDLRIDDVATATLFPGLTYRLPIHENWRLSPFVNVGYGKEFSAGEEALIYSGGVRSLGTFQLGEWRWLLGNAIYYAGNTRDAIPDLGFGGFEAAVDASHPTPWQFHGERLHAGAYAAYYAYSDLEFVRPEAATVTVANQYEVGLTLQLRQPIKIMGIGLDRAGIGYLTSDDLEAIRFVFSFPY